MGNMRMDGVKLKRKLEQELIRIGGKNMHEQLARFGNISREWLAVL